MAYRYTWLVASAMSLVAFAMLHDLLKPSTGGLPWQVIVAAGFLLGVAVSRAAAVYRLRSWTTALLHLSLMAVVGLRLGAPGTLRFGVLPTFGGPGSERCGLAESTLGVLGCHLTGAAQLIRSGAEPLIPLTGIVIVVTLVFWAVGALVGWGLSTGRPFLGLVPPFVLALELATIGREGTDAIHMVGFVLLALGGLVAVVRDEDRGTGRIRGPGSASGRRRVMTSSNGVLGLTAATSLLVVVVLAPAVPRDGLLGPTLLTGGSSGSISISPFVSIQQRLVQPQSKPLFTAQVEGDVPTSEIYFRLMTMDSYSPTGLFFNDERLVVSVDAVATDASWEYPDNEFFGPTDDVTTTIRIETLAQEWLPAAHAPIRVSGTEELTVNLQTRPDDASLYFDGGITWPGLEYSVTSRVPHPDVAALISTAEGELSEVFAEARLAGENIPDPRIPRWSSEPATPLQYLALPEPDSDNRLDDLLTLAASRTAVLATNFEKAVALEKWFHSPYTGTGESTDGFAYTTDIVPGQGASDLADWLLDPESPNFHQGYCENFATAMGVMARLLGIPSRVVLGFTPGTANPDDPSTVIVTDANAHAWVELWMPSQGWVRFDPTPRGAGDTPQTFESLEDQLGFPLDEYLDMPADRPPVTTTVPTETTGNTTAAPPNTGTTATPEHDDPGQDASGLAWPGLLVRLLWVVASAVVLLFSIPAVKWLRRSRRLRRVRDGDISAAWEQLVSRLADLDQPADPASTPTEVAHAFDHVAIPLADAYDRSVYGPPNSVSDEQVATAIATLERTEALITARYSRGERLRALYRPKTLVLGWRRGSRDRNDRSDR